MEELDYSKLPKWWRDYKGGRPEKDLCSRGLHVPVRIDGTFPVEVYCQNCVIDMTAEDHDAFFGPARVKDAVR